MNKNKIIVIFVSATLFSQVVLIKQQPNFVIPEKEHEKYVKTLKMEEPKTKLPIQK